MLGLGLARELVLVLGLRLEPALVLGLAVVPVARSLGRVGAPEV